MSRRSDGPLYSYSEIQIISPDRTPTPPPSTYIGSLVYFYRPATRTRRQRANRVSLYPQGVNGRQ